VTDIPLNANVECTDGPCGRSVCVIINPVTQQVTHIVVKERGLRHTERLLAVDQIAETTPHLIRLHCTRDELAKMEPFIETRYVRGERPRFEDAPYVWPFPVRNETVMLPLEHERIPPGELAVHRGAKVEATDGHVGRVDEFLADPANGHITHLVVREGHLWDQKDVTIPVSGVDHIKGDIVYLKLDKRTIESLPLAR
jgi:sporulation protein YlmC with PRC-barrel domain